MNVDFVPLYGVFESYVSRGLFSMKPSYALVICFPHPPAPGIVGTNGEITRAITRDYATITPLGGREITPLGTYRGKYRGILT